MKVICYSYGRMWIGGSIASGDGYQPFVFVIEHNDYFQAFSNPRYYKGIDQGFTLSLGESSSPYYQFDSLTSATEDFIFGISMPRDLEGHLVSSDFFYIIKWKNDGTELCYGLKFMVFKVSTTEP